MGQLLQIILDNLYRLWPVRVIDKNKQGVLFDRGRMVRLLLPGIHWFCPGMQRIDKYYSIYQQLDCGIQSMETKDGHAVTFSINIGYTIKDSARMAMRYLNFDHTLASIARGLLGTFISERTYEELSHSLVVLGSDMHEALRREVANSGVRIKDVRLDEFAKSRQLRLLGSSVGL